MLPASAPTERLYAFGFPDSSDGTWGPLLARYYEGMRAELPNERFFWNSLVRPGDRVLEIGAGSGFISSALAAGHPSSLTLVEPETTNVTLLRKHIQDHAWSVQPEIIQAPFGSVIAPVQDLIVFPFDSLPMVTSVTDRHEIFKKARQYLSRGGRFALHVSTPKWAEAYLVSGASLSANLVRLPDGTPVEVKRMVRRISAEHYLKFISLADLSTQIRENYLILTSVVTAEEILSHAAANGFELTERYGDFHRGPASNASEDDIFIFTAQGS